MIRRTKVNTTFAVWWSYLNKKLTKLGLLEASFGDALALAVYEDGNTPEYAAVFLAHVIAERALVAAEKADRRIHRRILQSVARKKIGG